jgi:hypothetical protein
MVTQAIPYLTELLHCSEDEAWTSVITIQVFDDGPTKDKTRAAIIHGCLDDMAERLDRLNTQGDGIYIAPNQTNLKGRTKESITHLRTVWADLDEKDATKPFALAALPLPPTMAVRSGHGTHFCIGASPSPSPATRADRERRRPCCAASSKH